MGRNRGSVRGIVTVAALLAVTVCTMAANAGPIIFASSDTELFRINADNSIDQFSMGSSITAMSFDANGDLWAASPDGGAGISLGLFKVDNPFGVPSLNQQSTLEGQTGSIEWVGSTLYATQRTDPPARNNLVTLNAATGIATLVGATGATGISTGGMTVDTSTSTMYAIDHDPLEGLATIDWMLTGGPDPSGTAVGPNGLGLNLITAGMDFWEGDSTLYAKIKNQTGPSIYDIGIYTVDAGTGAFTLHTDLSLLTAVRGSSAIAVIPEPASLALLGLSSVCLLRRRR